MKHDALSANRFTPLTITLLAISVICAVLGVSFAFYAPVVTSFARIASVVGPIATTALALILVSKMRRIQ